MTYKTHVDLPTLNALANDGYLKKSKHPTLNLEVWCYTTKTQVEKKWTPETLMCRGLVVDATTGKILARPFPKFFNHTELEELPTGPYTAYEKMDGSLGISYPTPDGVRICTKGSFTSDQAILANRLLDEKYPTLKEDMENSVVTYLFEIISPENRIVLDYEESELVLLGFRITDVAPATDLQFVYLVEAMELLAKHAGIRTPRIWEGGDLLTMDLDAFEGEEGYVLWYGSGEMVKIKFPWYIKRHRLLDLTARQLWRDTLDLGEEEIKEKYIHVSPDVIQWCDTVRLGWHRFILAEVNQAKVWLQVYQPERRDVISKLKNHTVAGKSPNPSVIFAILDGNQDLAEEIVLKTLKPPANIYARDGVLAWAWSR